jgi:hypothetical protein
MSATTVWQLPCMSQEFDQGPKIRQEAGDELIISYDFEQETGTYGWEEMTFIGVAAFSFTAAPYCSEEQVGAYDKLQELGESEWIARLSNSPPALRHYRIYFDDIGCYEVLARAFVPPARPER